VAGTGEHQYRPGLVTIGDWWSSVIGGYQLLVAISYWWSSVIGGHQLLVAIGGHR